MTFESRLGLTYYDGTLPSIIGYMIVQLHPDIEPKLKELPPPTGAYYWCPTDDVGWAGDSNRCWVCGRYTGRVNSIKRFVTGVLI